MHDRKVKAMSGMYNPIGDNSLKKSSCENSQEDFRLLKKPRRVRRAIGEESQIVFGRGMYVDENTTRAASVEFVCQQQTNYARSRL